MFSVREHRQFLCGGFAWTIWVEFQGALLSPEGRLTGADSNELWQWLTDYVVTVPGNDGRILEPATTAQEIGERLSDNPAAITAERFAALLIGEFRRLSDMVQAVTVLRTRLAGQVDDTVECTVRAREGEPVTAGELVRAIRSFAQTNGLAVVPSDLGPR